MAADDLLAEAEAELYGADPQQFTERRKQLAAAAKAAGDAAAARQIAALRKPTRAAWVVNRLVRDDPEAPAQLADLSAALRAAEEAKDGPLLRELSATRGRLIDTLTGQALAAADVPDPPAGLRDEVSATLTAALADPEVAAGFAAGTLTRAAEWAGFGLALSGPFDAGQPEVSDTSAQSPVPLERGRVLKEKRAERTRGTTGLPAGEKEHQAGATRLRRERLAEERAERLAQEAAEAAARRRKNFEDAERAVESATAAASDAVGAEDRLEAEVRDLEERLTRARAELADARLQARRAETAERKARRTLEQLPRPDDD